MNIRIDNETQRRIPRQHVTARITRALARLHGRPRLLVTAWSG